MLRVLCIWNIGACRAGTETSLPDDDAYRLEKRGAVRILRVIPGESLPDEEPAAAAEEPVTPTPAAVTQPVVTRKGTKAKKV